MAVVGRSGIVYAFLLFVALLLLPSVAAYTVEDVTLLWYEHEVTTIAPDTDLPGVVVNLTLSDDFQRCWDERPLPVCALILDVDGIAPLDGYRLEIRDRCRSEDGTITCTTVASTLNTPNGSIRIAYNGQAGTQRGITGTKTIPLVLDTTTPRVASIKTGWCDVSTCFIAANVPSPVTISFADDRTSYDWRLVFLGRDGSTSIARASACTGTTCTAELITPCQDGQEFTLALTSAGSVSSREDAQNTVAPFAGQRVVCKTQGPRITQLTMTADGIAGQAVSGGTLSVKATVTGGVGAVTTVVATNGILGEDAPDNTIPGTCVTGSIATERECTWQLQPLADGTFTLAFTATDTLGLYSTREERVTVLLLTAPPNGTAAIDYFDLTAGSTIPERLNRMAIDLTSANRIPFPLHVPYTVERNQNRGEILRQELNQCWYQKTGNTTWTQEYTLIATGHPNGGMAESRVVYPTADWNATNRLDASLRPRREALALADEFNVRCQIDLTIRDGNTIYNAPIPENLSFQIKLRDAPLGQPGQQLVRKIEKSQEGLDSSYARKIMKLEEFRIKLDKVCRQFETVLTVQNTIADVEVLITGACSTGVAAPFLQPVHHMLQQLQKVVTGASNVLWNGYYSGGGVGSEAEVGTRMGTSAASSAAGGSAAAATQSIHGGLVRQICRQVNCRMVAEVDRGKTTQMNENLANRIEGDGVGAFGSGDKTASYVDVARKDMADEVRANGGFGDPERSISGAITNMCLGGVVYNLQKHLTIECGYVQCLKQQAYLGQSISVCDQRRSFEQCVEIVGIVEELPIINIYYDLLENLNNFLQNLPVMLTKFGVELACIRYEGAKAVPSVACPDWITVACHFSDSLLEMLDGSGQTSNARGGLADPKVAQARVDLCEEALKPGIDPNAAQPNRPVGYDGEDALHYAAFVREQQAISTLYAGATDVAQADAHYANIAKGGVPSYDLSKTGNWVPINSFKDPNQVNGYYYVNERQNGQYQIITYEGKDTPSIDFGDDGEYTVKTTEGKDVRFWDLDDATITIPAYVIEAGSSTNDEFIQIGTDIDGNPILNPVPTVTPGSSEQSENIAYYLDAKRKGISFNDNKEGGGSFNTYLDEQRTLAISVRINDRIYQESYSRAGQQLNIDAPDWGGVANTLGIACTNDCETRVKQHLGCTQAESSCAEAARRKAENLPNDRLNIQNRNNQIYNTQYLTMQNKFLRGGTFTPDQTTAWNNLVDCVARSTCTEQQQDQILDRFCENNNACVNGQLKPEAQNVLATGASLGAERRQEVMIRSQGLGKSLANLAITFAGKQLMEAQEQVTTVAVMESLGLDGAAEMFKTIDKYADPKKREQSICGKYVELNDDDSGAVLAASADGTLRLAAQFGAEIRPTYDSENNGAFTYLTVVYVTNPQGSGQEYQMEILLTEKKSCATTNCADTISLTNGAVFNLSQGTAFANGNLPYARLLTLPGEYERVCIRFDHPYPDENGKNSYCRKIVEDAFEGGSPPVPGASTAPTPPAGSPPPGGATPSTNPLEGWQ